MERDRHSPKAVRYAVIGLGHFAQNAVLPAFKHAKRSVLAALVSDDPTKLDELQKRHDAELAIGYEQLDDLLQSGDVDAVYVATPNSTHRDFTVRAAQAGVHVLCEKPMAMTEAECEEMIRACDDAGVKLMIGYRLHFEEANMKAVELAQDGTIGRPRIFESQFSYQVKEGNIRVERDLGGGPLFDIGIYCVNAARYLFREEPTEVIALTAAGDDPRFSEIEEAVAAALRFPEEKLATFVVSYGVASVSRYEVLGTRGRLRVDPAYEYGEGLAYELTVDGHTRKKRLRKRDQIAPELSYFSRCILEDRTPEPSGLEGLADVRVLRAILQSAETGRAVVLGAFEKRQRPSIEQVRTAPPHAEPETVNVQPPHD
jgi:glucose-fructose oxidoreductase